VATRPAADSQRLNDLLALIEGPHSPQVRRTGARELLRNQWAETPRRIVAILSNAENRAARLAVAQALSDVPSALDPAYIEPLLGLLADSEAEVRQAAAGTLALYRDGGVVSSLRQIVEDHTQPLTLRQAAIDTLGLMTQREAVGTLVEACRDPNQPTARDALAGLERATAISFQDDPNEAQRWWAETQGLPLLDWQQLQIQRLVQQNRATRQRLLELEQRLGAALRDGYFRAADAERPQLLAGFLADPLVVVRLQGLDIARSLLVEGRTVPADIIARVRELLGAAEPAVRAAAIRTVVALRDPADAETLTRMMAGERHTEVRAAIVNGLGFVGGAGAVPVLLPLLKEPDPAIAGEVITALGRLAERGALDPAGRDSVAQALLARYRETPREAGPVRDQLLRAMSRMDDIRFGTVFAEGLDPREPVTIRQSSARGLAGLANLRNGAGGAASRPAGSEATSSTPSFSRDALLAALVSALTDPDSTVRRFAVEGLAQLGGGEAQVQALWSRLSPAQEPDDTVRETAWRGVVRVLSSRGPEEIEPWLARLPEEPAQARRRLDLLQLMERGLAGSHASASRERLGRVRWEIGRQREALEEPALALVAYQAALQDLLAAQAPGALDLAGELVRAGLRYGLYDADLLAALEPLRDRLEPARLWETVQSEADAAVRRNQVDRAVEMVAAFSNLSPAPLSGELAAAVQRKLEELQRLREQVVHATVQESLSALRARPGDEVARGVLLKLGLRAAPALRAALEAELAAEASDPAFERELLELLKALVPEWPGYDFSAGRTEKLAALRGIRL